MAFPPLDEVDEFGLPKMLPSLLGDTPEARVNRATVAGAAMRRLFEAATRSLGEAEARRLWETTAKPRRGRPKGAQRPRADREMLEMYDAALRVWDARPDLIRKTAEHFERVGGKSYGSSAEAIEKHLRALLKEREERERKQAELQRMLWGDASRRGSILGGDLDGGTG